MAARKDVRPSSEKLTHSPFAALKSALGERAEALPAHERPTQQTEPAREEAPSAPPKSRGRLVLRRETKRRAGKAVIVVQGFGSLQGFAKEAIDALAKELKQELGCGGTVERDGKEPEIVLQGDRAAKVAELLRARGFRVDGVTQ